MPQRQFNAGNYRYGFNGMEKDDKGEFGATVYNYGFRIYNPNIAKFLSVDPLSKEYPMLSSYQFATNRPIDGIDLDGLEYVRADQAYEDVSGSGVLDLTVSGNNLDHLLSATAITTGNQNIGYGVGGALLNNGQGTIVNDVWSGGLQTGALLQIWHPPINSTPYSGGGHSQVFESYIYDTNGNIAGMNIIDNYSNGQETIDSNTTDTINAVNLTDTN